MRIKIKFYNDWGNLEVHELNVTSKGTVEDLIYEIQRAFSIDMDENKLFIINNSKSLEITNKTQYLSSFQFSKDTILFIKKVDDEFSLNSSLRKSKQSFVMNRNSTSSQVKSINNSFVTKVNDQNTFNPLKKPIEEFYEYIQADNIEDAKNLVTKFESKKDVLLNDTSVTGYASLHVAVIAGSERMFLWILGEGGNINIETKDQWDCLSLAVCLKQKTILMILLGQIALNINKIGKHGSALHLAAQIDDPEIVQLLLKHPKIEINSYDGQHKRPFELAGTQVKQFLKYENEAKMFQKNRKSFLSSLSGITLTSLSKDSFIMNKPSRPPIITGMVLKVSFFKMRMYPRYMIADPDSGTIARFKQESDIPNNPNEIIPIDQIDDIKVSKDEWFQEDDYHYLEIKYLEKHIYIALKEKSAARRWYEGLKNCVGYVRYITQHFNKWKSENDKKFAKKAYTLMMEKPNQIMNIQDQTTIDQKIYIQQQIEVKKAKYKQQLQSVSEDSVSVIDFDISVEQGKQYQFSKTIGIQDFQVFELIGKGSFGNVYRAKYCDKQCALKQQEKDKLIRNDFLKYTVSELQILRKLNHPFIVKFYLSFQTQFYLYIATELCSAGDLSKYMTRGKILDEYTAKFITAQLILAIEYLHSKQIIYRDLKPENILIGQDGYIKLTDFGLCKQGDASEFVATSFCGSPAYLPPELIAGVGSTKATDIYQIGTILYEMLTGYPPFYCQNIKVLMENIRYQTLLIPKYVSKTATDLLTRLLDKTPEERLGYNNVETLKKHIFFAEINWDKLKAKEYKPPQLDLRLNYNVNRNGVNIKEQDHKILDLDYQQTSEKYNFVENWDFSY